MSYDPNQSNSNYEKQKMPSSNFNPNERLNFDQRADFEAWQNLKQQEKLKKFQEIRVIKHVFNNLSFFDKFKAMFLTTNDFACVFIIVTLIGCILILFEYLQILKLYGIYIIAT